jgi:excisionase family DNA binding protein
METAEWLNTTEAAKHLRIKPRTLAQWAREGKVPAHRLSGCQRLTWRLLRHDSSVRLKMDYAL